MYQNDVVELYRFIEHGELERVKEIIASNRVDIINALNGHEINIVNLLINAQIVKDRDAKLRILISAGALPKIDQNNNFLMQLVLLIKDISIRNEILTTVSQSHPKFKEYYRESHIQAIHGVKPEKDQALKLDGYGIYPIYYAIAAGAVTESWFEPKLYDITKIIDDGLYQGTCIGWWLLLNHRYDDFTRLTRDLTPEQCFEILKSVPLNSRHDSYMQTVFVLLLNNKSYDLLLNLTRELNKEPLKELLFHRLYKKAANRDNVEQYSTVIKVMLESHSDFAYKFFNQCTYTVLSSWCSSMRSDAIESQIITYLCFSKLHEILHVRFTNPPEALTQECKEDISKQLEDLFSYYQQNLFQPLYCKKVTEKLGMLLVQSAQTIFRKIVVKYLEDSGNQDYLHISHLAGNHALEGYAHTLRIIGHTDTANARALGRIHAQVKEKVSKLVEENEKLKGEIAELKRLEITKEEPSISRRTEKKPSFFAEALPVENGKNEQEGQPHGLKGERQLR